MIDTSKLKGVPETLMIPLMGRALETKKNDGILKDPKSVEIFEKLEYDFKKFNDDYSRRSFLRTTIRTVIIDQWVQFFLKDNPAATIVEIGCGLNTRYERLDKDQISWFDLDVPDVYKIWQQFFKETERRRFLSFSAFDEAWMRHVRKTSSGPYFLIAEASVIYFPKKKIQQLFSNMANIFPDSHYLFDSATPEFLKSLKKNKDPLKYCSTGLKWTIENIALLKNWIPGMEIVKVVDLESTNHKFGSLYPAHFRGAAGEYQLNLIRL